MTSIAIIVALGGFLMGFDASVISGVVGAVETEFSLTTLQLGWTVASLTLTASLAMLASGPLSDRYGRRRILQLAALIFAVSAIASALAPDYGTLVAARMLGGLGVGAALIVAPLYIAELAPPARRGQLVSFNQLNIVLGISVAFFSNYLILRWSQSDAWWFANSSFHDASWRVMLGIEAVPAVVYFLALFLVPESPRWLLMKQRTEEARAVFANVSGDAADAQIERISAALETEAADSKVGLAALWSPRMRLVMTVALAIAVLQQITGINAVFFYAPMIFEQSGIGTDASFVQAILVGLVNLVFTVVALSLIDRVGRRPLLLAGLVGITLSMGLLAYGFSSASYSLTPSALSALPDALDRGQLDSLMSVVYDSDVAYREALAGVLGAEVLQQHQSALVSAAISISPGLILAGILGFVASFAASLGPVMWVLLSELFPNRVRGLAISVAGLVNSAVSFGVQLVFPWELQTLGSATTFLLYGALAFVGLLFVWRKVPETKGRSLEQLEREFAGG